MSEENKARDVIDAVTGLCKAVPVYQDALQPAAKQIGTALETVGQAINVALGPLKALVWGYDQFQAFLTTTVAEKLKNVPLDKIVTPPLNLAGPLLESLRYSGHEEVLKNMYANLLAAGMDKSTASGAHPAFVEIIRQLTPDEARIVGFFTPNKPLPLLTVLSVKESQPVEECKSLEEAMNSYVFWEILVNFSILGYEAGCEVPGQSSLYIDNICRLGLARVSSNSYSNKELYRPLEDHEIVVNATEEIKKNVERKSELNRKMLVITDLGRRFFDICVVPHDKKYAN